MKQAMKTIYPKSLTCCLLVRFVEFIYSDVFSASFRHLGAKYIDDIYICKFCISMPIPTILSVICMCVLS